MSIIIIPTVNRVTFLHVDWQVDEGFRLKSNTWIQVIRKLHKKLSNFIWLLSNNVNRLSANPTKMVKHTQKIRRQKIWGVGASRVKFDYNLTWFTSFLFLFNPYHATYLFLYPLQTTENLWLSDVFRRHRRRQVE